MLCYSASKRIPEYGSITIRALVSSMYKHACHHDLYTIFKQVTAKSFGLWCSLSLF